MGDVKYMNDKTQLVPDDVMDAVVADYERGDKLRKIEERYELTRSQVYWVLQQREVAPQRTKAKSRLDDGNEQTVVRLYEVVEAQDARLQRLEDQIRALGEEPVD